jgi:SAM-dependent methyltransferase
VESVFTTIVLECPIIMLSANIEYIFLRLLRRFVFSDKFLLKYGRYLPYYKVNANQINPTPVVISYQNYLKYAGITPENLNSILEIGVGATNSTGYEMAAQGFAPQGQIMMLEPFTNYDRELDNKIFTERGYNAGVRNSVRRIRNLSELEADSVDLVLSNSVLEHIDDFSGLISDLCRVLRPNEAVLHLIDYRDHFFKYPYHFLQFSNAVWNRYLNPGDLP